MRGDRSALAKIRRKVSSVCSLLEVIALLMATVTEVPQCGGPPSRRRQ